MAVPSGRPALSVVRRLLSPVVQLREGEELTAALMFGYSFMAMTSYNVIKPVTRSKFISDLGADNLPWVQLGAGLLIGLLMHGYSRAMSRVPRRWAIPVTHAGLAVVLVVFWVLFVEGVEIASIGLYVLGQVLGILLISQFWTLADDIYDARHAKRLFGLIGGGASLGGAMGAGLTALIVSRVGTTNLLLVAAAGLIACLLLVAAILTHENAAGTTNALDAEVGVGRSEAFELLRNSRHLKLIAVIIGCAAIGGAIIEQQLNMAAEATLGQGQVDGITELLATVTVYLSLIGFAVQMFLTSRIHSFLGIGFALLILPISLGSMSALMLIVGALWVPAAARVLDTSIRYTVDKTTREILFLPLPAAVKYRAKPFIDVTVDRFAKAIGALLLLVLIKPWGLALTWPQLSYASLTLMAAWVAMAIVAKREYLASFRLSMSRQDIAAATIGSSSADLQTVELLIEELGDPDESRVLYALDLLDSLGKPQLVTPLLLHHTSPVVRTRALGLVTALTPNVAARWLTMSERLLTDDDPDVRASAARAVASIRGQDALALLRQYLTATDPRLVITAAVVLADAPDPEDQRAAADALERLASDEREEAALSRRDVARALGEVKNRQLRQRLVPLILDADVEVSRAAIRTVPRLGTDQWLCFPALVSLLGNRRLKDDVRTALIQCGQTAIGGLVHFLRDEREDIWVRRHIPATLARFPGQEALTALVNTLSTPDGFLRYKALEAVEQLHRAAPQLTIDAPPLETLALEDLRRCANATTLRANLSSVEGFSSTLLAQALSEKGDRTLDRVFRVLTLMHPGVDVSTAWLVLQTGDRKQRAGAIEYLDNVMTGALRKRLLPLIDAMPDSDRVRAINGLYGTRTRDLDDTLAQLVHDDDPVLAATAIQFATTLRRRAVTDDIAFVHTRRTAHEDYACEAAGWALRQSGDAGSPTTLTTQIPTVELVNQLRQVAIFAHVSVDELFRIAAAALQMHYEDGRQLFRAGSLPDTVEFLVDGQAQRADDVIGAPAALGLEELLLGTPMHATVHTRGTTAAVSMTREDFLNLLVDNGEMVRGLFRLFAERQGGVAGSVFKRDHHATATGRAESSLVPIDPARLLHQNSVFSMLSPAQLVTLASVTRMEALVPGSPLGRDDARDSVYVIARGTVTVREEGHAPETAQPGDMVGLLDALGDVKRCRSATVESSGHALRLDSRNLVSVLASDLSLIRAVLNAVHRATDQGGRSRASSTGTANVR